ncbi:NDR1/HIN1-like protein 10 [Vicia villosa]|uniref:NDR1/HIN1-like protein 10 n=1 Tax=Vicia villosa TaxID=3911 RepID=UPI00273B9567|nr:NDR1/HIN1-like protein 10 [Vicia villosa]
MEDTVPAGNNNSENATNAININTFSCPIHCPATFIPSWQQIKVAFGILFVLSVSATMMFMLVITFAPSNLKFHITDASLTKFNLTANNTLDYKLEANITSRNPNKNVEIYYKTITAVARYKDNEFARVNLSSFDQGHKNTTFLHVVFEGKGLIKLKPEQLFEYNQETRVGIYNDLAVDLDFLVRYKFVTHTSYSYNPPMVKCRRLSLSLISNGNSSSIPSFHVSRCRTRFFFINR